jgi:hypothetical protein
MSQLHCPTCAIGIIYLWPGKKFLGGGPPIFMVCNRKNVGCNWKHSIHANRRLLPGKLQYDLSCPACLRGDVLVKVNRNGPYNIGSAFLACSKYKKGACSWTHPMGLCMPISIDYEAFQGVDQAGEF